MVGNHCAAVLLLQHSAFLMLLQHSTAKVSLIIVVATI